MIGDPGRPPTLEAADARCLEAAGLLLDSLDRLPSPACFRRLMEAIDAARALLDHGAGAPAEGLSPGLVPLYHTHLKLSWGLLESVARARFDWPRRDPGELLDALAGPGALRRLEEGASRLDHEEIGGYLALRSGFRAGRAPASSPDARGLIERAAARFERLFKDWLIAREGARPGLDAQVAVADDETQRSWYEPERHRVVLNPAEFMVFEQGGGCLSVNPVLAVRALVHELAGHALQDAASRGLPSPLRPDHAARLRFASLPVAEGFAAWRTALAVPFAESHRADLGLSDRDLELLRRLVRLTAAHHLIPACVAVASWRARREPAFDPLAHLESLGLAGCGELLERAASRPLNALLYDASTWFGMEGVAAAAERLGHAAAGLARGGWALPCYAEAAALSD